MHYIGLSDSDFSADSGGRSARATINPEDAQFVCLRVE